MVTDAQVAVLRRSGWKARHRKRQGGSRDEQAERPRLKRASAYRPDYLQSLHKPYPPLENADFLKFGRR
jgi:hypothetical protein